MEDFILNNRKYNSRGFNYQRKFKPNIRRSGMAQASAKKKEDLYSKNWDDIRKLVYERDGHRCVLCGRKGKLHAHHIVPVKVSHDNSISNLVSVCEKCHRKLEQVGFTILESGGSKMEVRRAEFMMIMEAKRKRLERYKQKLLEQKILQEKEKDGTENISSRENRESRERTENANESNSKIAV